MASANLSTTISPGGSLTIRDTVSLTSTYCYLSGEVRTAVKLSSSGILTVGPVYLYLKNDAKDIDIVSAKIVTAGSSSIKGN